MPISGLFLDVYSPALPLMSDVFNVSSYEMNFSITVFLLGFSLSQLFWGWLSELYGRLFVLKIGLYVTLITGISICFVSKIWMVFVLRFMQGVSVAAANTTARTMIVDVFKGPQLMRYIQYVSIVWSLAPIVGPFIGGYIVEYFGWQMCFYFLSL